MANIKVIKGSQLPVVEDINKSTFLAYEDNTISLKSGRIDLKNMLPLFGVSNEKGQSVTFAVSEKAWTDDSALKADKNTIINVSQLNDKYNYTNRADARASIPAQLLGKGQLVTYQLASGEWITERQNILGKWESRSPISVQEGKCMYNTGQIVDNTNFKLHTINVSDTTVVKILTTYDSTIFKNGGAFFNAAGTYISGYTFADAPHGKMREIEVPKGAVTMKHGYPKDAYALSLGIPVFSTPQVYVNSLSSQWEEFNLDELYALSKHKANAYNTRQAARQAVDMVLRKKYKTISYIKRDEVEDSGWITKNYDILYSGKIIKSSGALEDNANYNVLKIDVANSTVLRIRCVYGSNSCSIFYSSSGSILGTHSFVSGLIEHGDIKDIPIPANAVEVRHNYPKESYAVSIPIPIFSSPSVYSNSAVVATHKLVVEQFFGDNLSDWINSDYWATIMQEQTGGQTWADDVISRNKESEKAVMACRKQLTTSLEDSNETYMPFFAHTSDLHGDAVRFESFVKYCEYLGVDAGLVTGDQVKRYYTDDFSYYRPIALSTGLRILHVLGNHDNEGADTQTDQNQYTRYFSGISELKGMIGEGKCYWHTDIPVKKIRIIGLNQYQQGGKIRYWRYFKQDQITWFINTLKTTPADYGILLLGHQPPRNWSKDNVYNKFWQSQAYYPFDMSLTNITGDPMGDIIDAFIGKTSINKNYVQDGALAVLSVTGDFSTLNTGVEFVAHLNGHWHMDQIGYLDNTAHKQLVLNVVAGQALPYEWCDLPRKAGTSCEDAFNVYGIDRINKVIRIARVGSNVTCYMEKRDFMIIPYK